MSQYVINGVTVIVRNDDKVELVLPPGMDSLGLRKWMEESASVLLDIKVVLAPNRFEHHSQHRTWPKKKRKNK